MIAVISHDAGGAEILSSWLSRSTESYCLVLDGPAERIFQRKLGPCQSLPLREAIDRSDWVLCGTSWQSNLERRAIRQSKNAGKKVVAFLDHWVNYQERFEEQGIAVYPDEIWVGDIHAESMAQKHFPEIPVVLKPNPYFEDLRIDLEGVNMDRRDDRGQRLILYVCEPIREHALLQHGDERYWGYTEEDALTYFLNNINVLGRSVEKIKIRPHPSESKGKYDWAIQANGPVIEIGGDATLLEEIAEADVVVGCESMAMVVALLARKRVVSSIPPGGKPCSLPHTEIEHMQQVLAGYPQEPHG